MKKKDWRSATRDEQEALRFKAVSEVLKGARVIEVANGFGLPRGTVYLWLKQYREGGMEILKNKPLGRRRVMQIGDRDVKRIIEIIKNKTPHDFDLPFRRWTCKAVHQLIENQFGIFVSITTIWKWLREKDICLKKLRK